MFLVSSIYIVLLYVLIICIFIIMYLNYFICIVLYGGLGHKFPRNDLNKKSSRGDMSVRISHISKID